MGIRVVCADRDPVLSRGLRSIADELDRVRFVRSVSSSEEIFQCAEDDVFDVLITDLRVRMGDDAGGNFVVPAFRAQFPHKGVVLICGHSNPVYVATLRGQEGGTIVHRDDIFEWLETGIVSAKHGASYASPTLSKLLARVHVENRVPLLSDLEVYVLRMILAGKTVNEIADDRFRAKQTISSHKMTGMNKLGLTSDAELFKLYIEDDFAYISENKASS